MAWSSYTLMLYSSTGVLLRTLESSPDGITWTGSLNYARAVNQVGTLTVTFPWDTLLWRQLKPESIIEVWRRGERTGRRRALSTLWWVRSRAVTLTETGAVTIAIGCEDMLGLIARRMVLYAPGTPESDKTGAAETLIKGYVTDNFISRNSLAQYLSIESDNANGPTLTTAYSWQNVLSSCQTICQASTQYGTYMCMDLEIETVLSYVFRVYTGQRGTDRSPSGISPLTLSPEAGILGGGTYTQDYHASIAYVAVTGQGDPSGGQSVGTATDASLLALGPFALTEHQGNGQNVAATTSLDTLANADLRANRPNISGTWTLVEGPGCIWGRDVDFGDQVTFKYLSILTPVWVEGVSIVVDSATGRETISLTLRSYVVPV